MNTILIKSGLKTGSAQIRPDKRRFVPIQWQTTVTLAPASRFVSTAYVGLQATKQAQWPTTEPADPDFSDVPAGPINPYARRFLALWLLGVLAAIATHYMSV